MLFLTLWRECNFVKYYFISHDYFTTCAILRNVKYSIIVIMFLGFMLLTNFVVSARIVMILFTSAMQCVQCILVIAICVSKWKDHGISFTVHTDTWVYKNSKHEFCVFASKHALSCKNRSSLNENSLMMKIYTNWAFFETC